MTLAAACLALAASQKASADGDPASDVLPVPGQDLYLPYSPPVSAPVATALRTLLKRTRAAGFEIKVAIIATPTDLGAVPNMFGQPQRYATFLYSEISFNTKSSLFVVMPAGYGAVNLPPPAVSVVGKLPSPGSDSDALARAAISAVVRLAAASGHKVPAPKISGGSSGGTSPALVFGAPVALLALAGLLMALRRRDAVEESREPTGAS